MDLLPPTPGRPGRKQTMTACAWIERENRRANFISCVSLGKGRIYRKSTRTTHRPAALDFNRVHLKNLLLRGPKVAPPQTPAQQETLPLH